MEQKILTWTRDSIDTIGTQLKDYLNDYCKNGWYVHQIMPTISTEFSNGNLRILSCIIILHKQRAQSTLKEAFEAGRKRIDHPDWDFVYETFEDYQDEV